MGEIRVLIAEDHPFMSQALRQFVDSAPGLTCVGEVRNGQLAVSHCALLVPDVVLMDMQMPVLNGVEATRLIAETYPSVKILALTTFSSAEYLIPALKAGASGYLLKDAEPEEIVTAVFKVHAGEAVLSPKVSKGLECISESHQRGKRPSASRCFPVSLSAAWPRPMLLQRHRAHRLRSRSLR